MTEPRIYVACLASYNNGVLHGRWIDLDDREEVDQEIAEMLRESPHPNVQVRCNECEGLKTRLVASCVSPDREPCPECEGKGTVPSAEEYAIHDFEGLPAWVGEYTGLDTIFEYLEEANRCNSDEERAAFDAWLEYHGLEDNFDYDEFRDAYRGTYASEEEAAEEYTREGYHEALENMPGFLECAINWSQVAREMTYGDFVFLDTPSGVALCWRT